MRCNGLQPGGALGGLRSRIGLLDQHIDNRERAVKRACYPLLLATIFLHACAVLWSHSLFQNRTPSPCDPADTGGVLCVLACVN